MGVDGPRVLVLQHERIGGLGLLGPWGARRGVSFDVLQATARWSQPSLDGVAAVVSLGSYASTHRDPPPWLDRELTLLARAHAAEVPVLGLCFGAQALAQALGGSTRAAAFDEVGWLRLDGLENGELDPGPWFFWHEDVFSPPPGSQPLGRTPAGPAGFRLGRSLGVQFHPEVDADMVSSWLVDAGDRFAAAERAEMLAGALADPRRVRERAGDLFDALLSRRDRR